MSGIGSRIRRYNFQKRKGINMTHLKKYLDQFHWYDETNENLIGRTPPAELKPEYPSAYQTYFGTIPSTFLRIREKILPHSNLKKLEKYIISKGFDISERGYESFKYVHFERKIIITGDACVDKRKDITEDEEDD